MQILDTIKEADVIKQRESNKSNNTKVKTSSVSPTSKRILTTESAGQMMTERDISPLIQSSIAMSNKEKLDYIIESGGSNLSVG